MKGISFILFAAVACSSHQPDESPTGKFNRQLQQCYEESDSIKMSPPVSGYMKYHLLVNADGSVKEAKILESAFNKDRNFEACVTGQMKRGIVQTIPEHKSGEAVYITPIKFHPVKK